MSEKWAHPKSKIQRMYFRNKLEYCRNSLQITDLFWSKGLWAAHCGLVVNRCLCVSRMASPRSILLARRTTCGPWTCCLSTLLPWKLSQRWDSVTMKGRLWRWENTHCSDEKKRSISFQVALKAFIFCQAFCVFLFSNIYVECYMCCCIYSFQYPLTDNSLKLLSFAFASAVWSHSSPCSLVHGSSEHSEEPAPKRGFTQCFQCGENPPFDIHQSLTNPFILLNHFQIS